MSNMKAHQSIKFNKDNLKSLKENVFDAVYLYLLLHPEELEKEWVMSLSKSKKKVTMIWTLFITYLIPLYMNV